MTDSSDPLLTRVREALAPKLEIHRELGAGGMGVVYLGHDSVLDRPVAIKILRPEAAGAVAAERFLREGRSLARIDHPNVVRVHWADHKDGVFHLVMDLVQGESLAHRLRAGPLPPETVRRIGVELCDAVAAIHAAGLVHRDIKPDNLIFRDGRVTLVDFGIAADGSARGELTVTGALIGTPAYMAPEQAHGEPATPQSDLWSLGATLIEAATGVRYQRQLDTTSLPGDLEEILRKAVAMDPATRWQDARAFRAALLGSRSRRRTVVAAGIGVLAVAAGLIATWPPPPTPGPKLPGLVLGPLQADDRVPAALRDSLEQALRRRLAGYPDFALVTTDGEDAATMRLSGTASVSGNGLRLDASLRRGGRTLATLAPVVNRSDWLGLVDSVGDGVAYAILRDSLGVDPWTPASVMPRARGPLRSFLTGERAFASGQWEQAHEAYLEAERDDSTCLLCIYRLEDVERWLNRSHDSARTARLLASAARFPAHYRTLIEASALPIAARLDTLAAAARLYQAFDLVWYRYGEELFHRGPLAGRSRSESAEAFRRIVGIRPDFAPAWYHLAELAIIDGDSAESVRTLAEYERLEGGSTGVPFAQLALLHAARSWRFAEGREGPATTGALITDPRLPSEDYVAAGPRLFLGFGVWNGALWLGLQLERRVARPELVRSGLIAQALAHLAEGRPDSAIRVADRLQGAAPDEESRLFAAALPAILALAEGDSLTPADATPLADRLRPFLLPGAARPAPRRAAAWLFGALGIASGQAGLRADGERGLGSERPAPGYLALLNALEAARRGTAGPSADSILAAEPAILLDQPAARAITRFWSARYLTRTANSEAALRVLRWAEHHDVFGTPTGAPVASELDWAFGPLARAQEAELLQGREPDTPRLCRLLAAIAADWAHGARSFAERAKRAREQSTVLGCGRAS